MPHFHQHCCCRALQAIFQAVPKQSAAQFGWWQACSVRGEVSPGWFPPFSARSPLHWHPSSPISAIVQMRLCPPFASRCLPPTHLRSIPIPAPYLPQKPKDPAIIQSLKLSQEPVSLRLPPSNLPILPSSTSLHPSTPVPPQCIPAWQTTWDFTSPLKSAASGNHSSSCNILVF